MTVTRTTIWSDNQVLTAAALNGEFNNLLNSPSIVNADISAGAAIAYSKLNLTGDIVNADISSSAAIAASKISGTAATLGGTQSFTAPNTFAQIAQTITTYTPAGGGTATIDLSKGNLNFITMPAGNITIALSNEAVGQAFIVRITQDSSGSRTVTWFTTIKWAGGTAPTLTTAANKTDTFGFIVTSSGNYDGYVVGQNV